MELRLAAPGDAQSLLDIYGQYIRTPITFEYELPSPEEFAGRISSTLEQGYPYLVCEEAGVPLGYAYAHRIWARAAYQWGAELSIYLPAAVRGPDGAASPPGRQDRLRRGDPGQPGQRGAAPVAGLPHSGPFSRRGLQERGLARCAVV